MVDLNENKLINVANLKKQQQKHQEKGTLKYVCMYSSEYTKLWFIYVYMCE